MGSILTRHALLRWRHASLLSVTLMCLQSVIGDDHLISMITLCGLFLWSLCDELTPSQSNPTYQRMCALLRWPLAKAETTMATQKEILLPCNRNHLYAGDVWSVEGRTSLLGERNVEICWDPVSWKWEYTSKWLSSCTARTPVHLKVVPIVNQ